MVANAVKDGITYYEYENIKKNYFVAVATEDPSDNWGAPQLRPVSPKPGFFRTTTAI